ncbi:type I-U CRISPR-associated protein Csx17 [Dactylosporangium sp. NPDC051485]|uniref:type I-G CRISPR-associated protein Cas8g1/Csx17 n=1 Tax=Dactylosporangium sp. NPDC051485 TaxID=3154846 RepID=UPI00342BCD56
MTRHTLPGVQPAPLSAYLAGLGLIRLLGEQADPALTAAWTADGLVVDTTVPDLPAWLVERYVPTPIVTPWNGGSGFGLKDKAQRQALDALVALASPRLDPYRAAVAVARQVADGFHHQEWSKERSVRELRNRCPEQLLPWLDAVAVLTDDQVYFPPLLGTGGNDGRLEFSSTFHQRLLDMLDPAVKARQRSLSYARDALDGTQIEPLQRASVGQFDLLAAGGPASSPFGAADSLVNPWQYILLLEGALLFAASPTRRHLHAAGRAAVPFTVTDAPDGTATGAAGEVSRGEVWVPTWHRPFTADEVKQLFTDARAAWRGRPAQRAVDFYAATRTLGVASGVDGFVRYGMHRRNGLAHAAVPLERVVVTHRPEVRLAARLEDWVSRCRGGVTGAAIRQAVRRFDQAHVAFARDGGPLHLAGMLAAVTNLEHAAGHSARARRDLPVRTAPSAREFLDVLAAAECPELRIAVGLASCATRPSTNTVRQPVRTMRHLLLPVDPDRRWRDTALVTGFGLRPLRSVLAEVLIWRSRTAADERGAADLRGIPTFRTGIRVPDADLHAFVQPGQLDDDRLDLWLRASLALDWDRVDYTWTDPGSPPIPVPILGLLQPFAEGLAQSREDRSAGPRLGLQPDWPARLVAGQIDTVHADAVRRLKQCGWQAVPALPGLRQHGPSIAAALLPRCRQPRRTLSRHLARPIQTEPSTGSRRSHEPAQETQ